MTGEWRGAPAALRQIPEGGTLARAINSRYPIAIPPPVPHILTMKTHPHADATYRVVSISETQFSVEVTIPDHSPTMVSPFTSADAAEAWIAGAKSRVADESEKGRWFRRSDRSWLRR